LRHKNLPLGEYLALLSVKHSIDPDKFFQALVSLKELEKVECGGLSIEFRGRIKNERILLMTRESTVVGQFRIPESFLMEDANPIRRFMNCDRIRRYSAKKAYAVQSGFIGGLSVGMNHITLSAKVLDIQKPASVFTRYGESAIVANALIGDKTGTIKLCLWDAQVRFVSKGDTVHIKNARAFAFRGEKQLRLGRNGTISVEKEKAITT
jgi:replication factor A1